MRLTKEHIIEIIKEYDFKYLGQAEELIK